MLTTNLNNGIKVVIDDNKYINSALIGILVKSGSIYETKDNIGISHFIEHMLFKGTTNRSSREIAEEIDFVGGQINAFTTKEHTFIYAKVPYKHMNLAIDIIYDMLMNSLFLEADIQKEKKVIIEEIKMYKDLPDDLVFEMMSEIMFKDNPLSFPILGTENTVNNISRNEIIKYYRNRYNGENFVISIAGNVDTEDIIYQLNNKFEKFRNNNFCDETSKNNIPSSQSKVVIKGEVKKTEQLNLCFAIPYCSTYSNDYFEGLLVNNYIGGSMSSILYQIIREDLGLAYEIESSVETYKDAGLLEIYVALDSKNAIDVLEIIKKELVNLYKNKIGAYHIDKYKEQLIGNYLLSIENPFNKLYDNGKELLDIGFIDADDKIINQINQISEESVSKFIDKYFTLNQVFLTYVGNIKNKIKFEQNIHDIFS